jgi:hypothetical protein
MSKERWGHLWAKEAWVLGNTLNAKRKMGPFMGQRKGVNCGLKCAWVLGNTSNAKRRIGQ